MLHTLDDLLFTLRISQDSLPSNVHPDHYERLLEIEKIIGKHFANDERNERRDQKAEPSAN